MPNCRVYVDRRIFRSGEVVYITLSNVGQETLLIGSWGILRDDGAQVYSVEPPQIQIPPSSSMLVQWFQQDNEGRQVGRGRYIVVWRPRTLSGVEYFCESQVIEIA